jgi:hypothetical protein
MIVCSLCENAQEYGDACEVCGRPFPRGEAVPVEVPAAEGLEATLYAGVAIAGEALEGLEPTRHGGVDLPAVPAPDLEPTRVAPVDVDAPALEGLEPTDAGIPGDEATPFPALHTCRYCRTPASPGERICARCGMRLPVVAAAVPEPPGGEHVRICGCGTPARGPVCPSCGARAG